MKFLLDLIQTPLTFALDPLGTLENYPLNVIIWVGMIVWAIRRHRKIKKQKEKGIENKDNTKKLY
jgi:hypothetical protein